MNTGINEMNETKPNNSINMSSELLALLEFMQGTLAKELPTLTADLDYFTLAVFSHKHNNIYRRLDNCLVTSSMEAIHNSYYQLVSSKALTAVKSGRKVLIDTKLAEILENAEKEAMDMGSEEVTSEHVFLSILADTDDDNKARKLFNKAGITYGILKNKILDDKNSLNSINDATTAAVQNALNRAMSDGNMSTKPKIKIITNDPNMADIKRIAMEYFGDSVDIDDVNVIDHSDLPGMPKRKTGKNANIKAYCTNLNELAEQGKIEPLVGRDKEVNEIIRILGRKKKNNAILLGGEGVGKTAIGEALAYKIVNDEVPDFLANRVLVSLDMTALMAGTTLRGMFEERVKGILDEIKADPSFILFMDNIGAILADKGKNDYEISAMLARSLENGEIQVIGTSDFTSYRKTFDKDPSLARRFQKIVVEAPSIEESLHILFGLRPSYEKFHNVQYDDDAIEACVTLAGKYIPERNLPDSAIDILDEVGALKGTIIEPDELRDIREDIKMLKHRIQGLSDEHKFEDADVYNKELTKAKREYNTIKNSFAKNRKENPVVITKSDILDIVSMKTNIPVSNLSSDDKKKLMDMNERIKAEVIGQNEAIDTICKALKRNRIGLHKGGCMYSAMTIGKTGVGKTLIAKKLAKELFGDEKALVRFDMSEFSDKVAVNKLIGSNPGYVGYEEGGQLTEIIKNKKHCVLLLDEIEKADPEIYNIFLQVLDEGFLTDNSGQKVDFKNVIVLFTSNIGAKSASDFGKGIGFNENESGNTKKILLRELKNKFPPEFLNRLDDVIYFNALSTDDLKSVIKLEIEKLNSRVKSIGYDIEYDDNVIDYILDSIKDDKEFGARPIMRAIQDVIEDKITDALLENNYEQGYKFKISCCSDLSEVVVA